MDFEYMHSSSPKQEKSVIFLHEVISRIRKKDKKKMILLVLESPSPKTTHINEKANYRRGINSCRKLISYLRRNRSNIIDMEQI